MGCKSTFRVLGTINLVFEAKNRPEKLRQSKDRERELTRQRTAVSTAISSIQNEGMSIESSMRVCERVKQTNGLEVS